MAKDIANTNYEFANLLLFPELSFKGAYRGNKYVTLILSLACLVLVLSWYIKFLWKRKYLYYHAWKTPGPFALPIIGCAYKFLLSGTTDIMQKLIELQKQYPDVMTIWFGPKLIFGVGRPEHIEKILTSPKAMNKDNLYKFLSFVIGDGLMTARGMKWKKHRKTIMPAFNQKILDQYQIEVFAKQSQIFVDLLQKRVGDKNIDLVKMAANCTLSAICQTACGLNIDFQTQNLDFVDNLDKLMEITTYRIFNVQHHLEFSWNWYPLSKEYAKVIKNFKDFTRYIVEKNEEAYRERKQRKSLGTDDGKGLPKTVAFLDLIKENFTHQELLDEVDIFIIAGTDTTALTICCTLVMLGMHQDVQEKVLDEVLSVVGPDRTPTPSDLPLLKYTERVIKESLRVFPVGVFFLREIVEDIDAGDMIYPAGCSAFFCPVHIHRNPKYWPDPLKFDPDRFLPENVAKRHPCAYVAFSYGSRNCIGGRYAIINIKTILAMVVRKLKIFTEYKSVEEIKLKSNITIKLHDGPKVWFENR
ncbi:unnamed protein product [Phyllotreta striolata]|uniref:Cytochrome P450 monooxygenase n=1 Tax=Phyllotreta striolata TaxID=444603 RepID=A0A9N9TW43_PHYSR|nr:unnamed protein product [Phyllotreta striolata]